MSAAVRALSLGLALALAAGCGPRVREGLGTVVGVDADRRQIVLAHEAIEDWMPAMTMSFDVAESVALAGLAPGARVRFHVEVDERTLRIVSLETLGPGAGDVASGGGLAAVVAEADPAPPFALLDQDGREVSLASLRGAVVLLDFVYTSCPGPCPILTSKHVEVQRALLEPARARVRFVSISLDPARDTPEALRSYAQARGADLGHWSFLTGAPDTVAAVLASYGVGTVAQPDGEIEHVVATFLIDAEGNIAKRYFGLEHPRDQLVRDLTMLADG